YHLSRANQLRRVDQELQQRVSVLVTTLRPMRGPPGFPPPDDFDRGPDRGPEGFPPPHPGEEGRPLPEIHLRPEHSRLFDADGFYYIIWWRDGRVVTRSGNAPTNISIPERLAGHSDTIRTRGILREDAH